MNSETRMPAAPSALTTGPICWRPPAPPRPRARGPFRRPPPRHVEAAFGGALLASLRHQAGGVRAEPQRDRRHLVGRRHLEIERLCETLHQARHVVVPDMAGGPAPNRPDDL